MTFRVVTVHVYGAPAVRPVTVMGLAVSVADPVTPLPLEVHVAVASITGLPPSEVPAVNGTTAEP